MHTGISQIGLQSTSILLPGETRHIDQSVWSGAALLDGAGLAEVGHEVVIGAIGGAAVQDPGARHQAQDVVQRQVLQVDAAIAARKARRPARARRLSMIGDSVLDHVRKHVRATMYSLKSPIKVH